VGGQQAFYFEPQCAAVFPKKSSGRYRSFDILSSTQSTANVLDVVASALGLPLHSLTVHCDLVGGPFGGKQTRYKNVSL